MERNPGTVRVSTENSKAAVILARCAILGPATAVFRLKEILLAKASGKSALQSPTLLLGLVAGFAFCLVVSVVRWAFIGVRGT